MTSQSSGTTLYSRMTPVASVSVMLLRGLVLYLLTFFGAAGVVAGASWSVVIAQLPFRMPRSWIT